MYGEGDGNIRAESHQVVQQDCGDGPAFRLQHLRLPLRGERDVEEREMMQGGVGRDMVRSRGISCVRAACVRAGTTSEQY